MGSNVPAASGIAFSRVGAAGEQVLPSSDVQLKHLLAIFRRRRGTILAWTLVCGLIAVLITLAIPRRYSATATIELTKASSGDPLGLQDLSGIGAELGGGGEQLSSDLLTQLTVISSDTADLSVIKALGLEGTPAYALPSSTPQSSPLMQEKGRPLEEAPARLQRALAIFHSRLKVEIVKGTRLIAITYEDEDPAMAARVANEMVIQSIDLYTQSRQTASEDASSKLNLELNDLKARSQRSQDAVEKFEHEHNLSGISMSSTMSTTEGGVGSVTVSNAPLERLLQLNKDLTSAEVLRTEKEAIYEMARTQDPNTVVGIGLTELANGSGSVSSTDLALLQTLRAQEADLRVRLETASGKYGAKNPEIANLQTSLASIRRQIVDEVQRIKRRTENDLALAKRTEAGLRAQVAAQQQEVARTGNAADMLVLLREQAGADQSLYQNLRTKLQEADVVSRLRASNIIIVDRARIPVVPSSPQRKKDLGIGLLTGAVLGSIFAFYRAFWSGIIYGEEDVVPVINAPLIARIPDFTPAAVLRRRSWLPWSSRPVRGGARALAPSPGAMESFRALRTVLLASNDRMPLGSVLFMSPSSHEGRSTSCSLTARVFAEQGFRVLLIDADLRDSGGTPGVPQNQPVGLTSCLESGVSLAQAIQASPTVTGLSVLPAGPSVTNPADLLGRPRFAELLAEAEQQFDFVFLDSPPALWVTDADVIGRFAKTTLLVARAGVTTRQELERMADNRRILGQRPLGVCLNAAEL